MITPIFAAALSMQTLLRFSATSSDPLFGPDPAAPVAAPGLWAATTGECAEASRPGSLGAELARWPGCATPLRIGEGTVALLSPPKDVAAEPLRRFSTAFALAPAWPGAPAVMQLEVPGLLDTTYAYAALQAGARDASGRFTSARFWPVICSGPPVQGLVSSRGECRATTPTAVHEAARQAPVLISVELRWVAP